MATKTHFSNLDLEFQTPKNEIYILYSHVIGTLKAYVIRIVPLLSGGHSWSTIYELLLHVRISEIGALASS